MFKAKIKSKKMVAKGTLQTEYDLFGKIVKFKPGQIFNIALPGGLEHHFTIVNSPNNSEIFTNTTRLRDTQFKNTLKDLPIGTEVEVGDVTGDFILPEIVEKPLVFIALGIGITPFVSMVRFIKEEGKDYKITLVYSDSDRESMAYLDELEEYAKENPNFKIFLTITKDENWTGEKRHIDEKFINDYFKNSQENLYLISGPPQAVTAVIGSLKKVGIAEGDIKSENFFGY